MVAEMAYRVNAKFKDGSTNGPMTDIVAEPAPHCGDTISVSRHGHDVAVKVIAVWTPSSKTAGRDGSGLVMVEACEI